MSGISDGGIAPLNLHVMLTTFVTRPGWIVALAVVLFGYAYGVRKVRAGGGSWSHARAGSFYIGMGVLAVSLLSFVGAYDTTLFWVHMIQHLALIMVGPALLAGGGVPQLLVSGVFGERVQSLCETVSESRVFTTLTSTSLIILYYAVTVVVTHLTGLMPTIMASATLTDFEHVLYLTVGYLYFVAIFGEWPGRRPSSFPTKFLLVVLTMPIDAFTGVVLTLGTQSHFPARSWGPSPVHDLNWGGGVMWLGSGLIMSTLIFAVMIQWMSSNETSKASKQNLFERARFQHITGDMEDVVDVDDDERVLAAYNEMLARKYGKTPS